MTEQQSASSDMQKMIADSMENGLLDNIVDMFKYDKSLYDYLPGLVTDERMRVRIGTIALLETLATEDAGNIDKATWALLPLLKSGSPLVAGDVAYILGLIGNLETIPFLEEIAASEDPDVRTIVQEAVEDIRSRH
jgi:hypothetical protein